jgi:hypothetical protein
MAKGDPDSLLILYDRDLAFVRESGEVKEGPFWAVPAPITWWGFKYRSISAVTSSTNAFALSSLRTSGRYNTAGWVKASTACTD